MVNKESSPMTTLYLTSEWLWYAKSNLNTVKYKQDDNCRPPIQGPTQLPTEPIYCTSRIPLSQIS